MRKTLFFIITFIFLFSCKHEIERPILDVDMILPIAHTKLNTSNIISDTSTIINEEENGLISLIYQEKLLDVNYDSLLILETTTKEKSLRIDSVNFDDVVITDVSTIGSIISQDDILSWLLPDGANVEIPQISGIRQNDSISIDASEYFQTMTLYNGTLTLEIENEFPTDISNVSISLYNAINQNLIATFSTPLIESGGSYSESISVADETLDYLMIGVINNIDVEASNGNVTINYSDAITTTISITNIQIMEATAYFPNQLLYEEYVEYSFDLGTARIREIGVKQGEITINALSTLPDTATIIYSLPSLTKDGNIFETIVKIPPNTHDEPTQYSFQVDGYTIDLTGKEGRENGDTVNTLYATLQAYLDSTGELETINKVDSFYLFSEYVFIPEYAKGYIGQDTLIFHEENREIDMFNEIESSNIDLESAKLNIKIENYIGADLGLYIDELVAENEQTNTIVSLNDNTLYNINRSTLTGNTITPTYSNIEIEVNELLEVLPNKINTSAHFYLNPNGESTEEDFLFPEFPIEAILELKIPLSFIANELTLSDTTDIKIDNIDNVDEMEILYITLENGLPLEAYLTLITMDEAEQVIDTLIVNQHVLAGLTNTEGEVIEISTSTIEITNVDFSNIKKIKTIASFNTQPTDHFVSIYNTQELNIIISGKFNATIGE